MSDRSGPHDAARSGPRGLASESDRSDSLDADRSGPRGLASESDRSGPLVAEQSGALEAARVAPLDAAHTARDLRAPSLWRHRDFKRLWAAPAVSAFGSRITRPALPIIAVKTLGAH